MCFVRVLNSQITHLVPRATLTTSRTVYIRLSRNSFSSVDFLMFLLLFFFTSRPSNKNYPFLIKPCNSCTGQEVRSFKEVSRVIKTEKKYARYDCSCAHCFVFFIVNDLTTFPLGEKGKSGKAGANVTFVHVTQEGEGEGEQTDAWPLTELTRVESTQVYSQDGSACHRKRSNPPNLVHDKVAEREGIQAATVLWKLPKDKQRQRRTTVVLCNLSFPKGFGYDRRISFMSARFLHYFHWFFSWGWQVEEWTSCQMAKANQRLNEGVRPPTTSPGHKTRVC